MINNVTLIGRLTRDAELRYTPSNIATAQFNIACNRNFKTEQMPPNYANPMDIDDSDLPF